MTSVGETLRHARLKRNLELSRISSELKISSSMLKAIEENRFDKLPGGVFARSFVRQYARFLELDENEIVDELNRFLEPPPPVPQVSEGPQTTDIHIPLPRLSGWQAIGDKRFQWSSSVWSLVLVVAVMLVCAGAYAWWLRDRHPAARARAPVTAQAPRPAPAPPAPPVAAVPPPATAPAPANTAPPALQAESEAAAVAASRLPEPNPNAPVQVELVAQQPTWISVRTDGQYAFSGTLEANQSRTVSADRNVLLKIGNAGGIEIRLNGKPIGPLGEDGSVRTVQFTSGGFHIVPREAPSPEAPAESPNPL